MAFDLDVIKLFGAEYYYPCEVDQTMMDTGWVGGQWVKFVGMTTVADGNNYRVRRFVEKSDPDHPVFFMVRGAYEPVDQYTGIYPGRTGVVSCGVYGQYLFKHYETVDLAERTIPGSGSPLVYSVNGDLFVSDRGLLTTEAETVNARTVGICIGLPADNNDYLPVFIGY